MDKAKNYLKAVIEQSPFTLEEISWMSNVAVEKLESLENITAGEFESILSSQGVSLISYLKDLPPFPAKNFLSRKDIKKMSKEDIVNMGSILRLIANTVTMDYLDKNK